MTTQTEFIDLARRSQEAFAPFVHSWADATRDYVLPTNLLPGGLLDARETVDKAFDFAEQVLHAQREYVTAMVSTAAAATEAVRKVSENAWKIAEHAAEELQATRPETTAKTNAARPRANASAE
jgi:hypothetical protein